MNFIIRILVFILIFHFSSYAGRIIYPWNARTVVVKTGDSLEIWYSGNSNEAIQSINLLGPYSTIPLPDLNIQKGDVVYDAHLNQTYNFNIKALVPISAPSDLYTLEVITSTGNNNSVSAVKLVKEYKTRYTFVHVTDSHVGAAREYTGNMANEMQYFQRVIRALNIISPEFVIATGDNIHDNSDDLSRKWSNYYSGISPDILGVHDLNTVTLSTPGNHDFNTRSIAAEEWNIYSGLRFFGFSYGDTRILAFDDYLSEFDNLPSDFPGDQETALANYLNEKGTGKLRIIAQHFFNNIPQGFVNTHSIGLGLTGHIHRHDQRSMSNQADGFATGSAGHYSYVGENNVGWFRVITIDDGNIVQNDHLQFGNSQALTDDLTLTYSSANDGTGESNSATITNSTAVEFESAKIRFVMTPGRYVVTGGTVESEIHNDSVSVVDVRVLVESGSNADVSITTDLSAIGKAGKINLKNLKLYSKYNAAEHQWDFAFYSPKKGKVILELKNIEGKKVQTIFNRENIQGSLALKWKSQYNLAPGLYVLSVKANFGSGQKQRVSQLLQLK